VVVSDTVPVLRSHSLLALAVVLAPIAAHAKPLPKPAAKHGAPHHQHHPPTAKLTPIAQRAPAPPPVSGKSIGSPTEGHLLGGAHLTETPYLRIVPTYAAGDVRWGLEPLVGMIDRAAKSVRKQYPDAVLSVGHLSRHGGGELDRHASHESGRDADIGFYIKNQQQKPLYADHFVAFKPDGTAPTWPGAYFDDARNWALIAALVGDGHAHVTHIFVTMGLRTRLLEYAQKIGAPPNLRTRAAEVMAQPKGALPHDDHFHVRIACPSGMDKCIEQPLVKKHSKHHGAVAHAPHATHPHALPHPHTAKPSEAKKSESPPHKEESAKSDSIVPSLAPSVPGLDSAVIPAPLETKGTPATPAEKPAPQPAPPVVDDPDGVLGN
jgi:penicillin-insensitive murein DD-endopeptidase